MRIKLFNLLITLIAVTASFLLPTTSYADDLLEAGNDEDIGPQASGPGTVELNYDLNSDEDEVFGGIFDLESAVDWALEHNREIERLELELNAASEAYHGSRLLYTPTVAIGGRSMKTGPATSFEIPGPTGDPMEVEVSSSDIISTLSFTFNQPVYMFGAFRLARQSSSIAFEQASLNLERARQTVRNQVETAFLQAALAQELEGVQMKAVETAEERLRIAQVRYDAGNAAYFEVLRAQVDLATARESYLGSQTASELATAALVQKMGLPSGTEVIIDPPDPDDIEPVYPSITLIEAWQTATENRPDLKSLELAENLTEIGVASQRNRPSLVFQGNYSLSDQVSGFGDKESWSLILNLTYDLFDSGKADAAIEEARSRREAFNVQLEDTRTLIELEVESAYRSVTDALERIEVSSANVDAAAEALRIAELGYSEGVIPYIDYQDADLGLRQAETMYLQAVYNYLIADSNLRAALGTN